MEAYQLPGRGFEADKYGPQPVVGTGTCTRCNALAADVAALQNQLKLTEGCAIQLQRESQEQKRQLEEKDRRIKELEDLLQPFLDRRYQELDQSGE